METDSMETDSMETDSMETDSMETDSMETDSMETDQMSRCLLWFIILITNYKPRCEKLHYITKLTVIFKCWQIDPLLDHISISISLWCPACFQSLPLEVIFSICHQLPSYSVVLWGGGGSYIKRAIGLTDDTPERGVWTCISKWSCETC